MYKYDLCIHPVHGANFDYYEVKDIEFLNPIHKGDVAYHSQIEMEIKIALHEEKKIQNYMLGVTRNQPNNEHSSPV